MPVEYELQSGEPLTPEQEKRLTDLQEMSDEEIICDEEMPELTDEQLRQMIRPNKIQRTA